METNFANFSGRTIQKNSTTDTAECNVLMPTVSRRGCSKDGFNQPKLNSELDSESKTFLKAEHGNYGEDGFFIVQTVNYLVFGIADGVGSWWEKGIDPAIFSSSLVKHACRNSIKIIKEIEQETDSNEISISALHVMQTAYDELLRCEGNDAIGSSTACFGVYNLKTKILDVANLGDSGIYIHASNNFEFLSKQMQRYSGCPYQLTNPPVKEVKKLRKMSYPKDAVQDRFLLSEGDYFIVGSDGVWDNADMQNMPISLNYNAHKGVHYSKNIKLKHDMTEKFASDFFDEILYNSKRFFNYERLKDEQKPYIADNGKFYGGKKDDISLIVVLI